MGATTDRVKSIGYLRLGSVALLVIVASAVFCLIYLKHQYNDARAHDGRPNQEHAESLCVRIPFLLQYCFPIEINSNREAERANEDLRAQQEMADWTFAALLMSLVAVAVSGIGLIALFWSLDQTQTAIRDNREIGEKQTRAYLEFSKIDCSDQVEGGGIPKLKIAVNNRGISPAWFLSGRVVNISVTRLESLASEIYSANIEPEDVSITEISPHVFKFVIVQKEQMKEMNKKIAIDGSAIYYDLIVRYIFIFKDVFDYNITASCDVTYYCSVLGVEQQFIEWTPAKIESVSMSIGIG